MQTFRNVTGKFPTGAFTIGIVGLALGLALIIVLTLPIDKTGIALAAGCLFGLAALVSGGLLGFVFGIPRTNTSESPSPPGGQVRLVRQNTNLEQISDWLTKILVGVTLTQLPSIGAAAGRLIDSLARALGDASYSPAVAGAILVYFSVFGFLAGWLLTSLLLPRAIAEAGGPTALLAEATQLSAEGKREEAKLKAQQAAAAL